MLKCFDDQYMILTVNYKSSQQFARSNLNFEPSYSVEISNLYVKFVKDLNCRPNNGIVGRKVCNFRNSRI